MKRMYRRATFLHGELSVAGRANSSHGFHLHAGRSVGDGCGAAGPHYNPEGVRDRRLANFKNCWHTSI